MNTVVEIPVKASGSNCQMTVITGEGKDQTLKKSKLSGSERMQPG